MGHTWRYQSWLLVLFFLFGWISETQAAFPIANQAYPELKPSVAYNSTDHEFMSAYLIVNQQSGWWELKAQRFDLNGNTIGSEISPLAGVLHLAGGRPDIAYSPVSNTYYIAVPIRFWNINPPNNIWDHVIGLEINSAGTRIEAEDYLFNDKILDLGSRGMSSILDFESPTIVRVTYNSILNEFMVTFRRGAGTYNTDTQEWEQRIEVLAQRVNSDGLVGQAVLLSPDLDDDPVPDPDKEVQLDENWQDIDTSGLGKDAHAIAWAPISTTAPGGGRYLFKYKKKLRLLDASGTIVKVERPITIAGVPTYFKNKDIYQDLGSEGISSEGAFDIAYGKVQGEHQFLLTWWDTGNVCEAYGGDCWLEGYRYPGVWGTYIDPARIRYFAGPKTGIFPLTQYWSPFMKSYNPPNTRVSYSAAQEAFLVVWSMMPAKDSNPWSELGSHIRGTWVNEYVYANSLGPPPPDNFILSDITGTTCDPVSMGGYTAYPCYSKEDPAYPDIAAGAMVIWQQRNQTVATNLDVFGSSMSWSSEDSDGDGVDNLVDNCIDIPNPGQADADQDGFGNLCDVCAIGHDGIDQDKDGTPDDCDTCPLNPLPDTDSDGYCGDDDNCPGEANPDQADMDGDGIGDACDVCPVQDNSIDRDFDGIPDACDTCPDNPGADPDEDYACGIDDCAPDNPLVHPGAYDVPNDGIDQDCQGGDAGCTNLVDGSLAFAQNYSLTHVVYRYFYEYSNGEVHQTTDGGFVFAGTVSDDGYKAHLVKTDGQGAIQWEKRFTVGSATHAFSVVQTSDGGYVLSGVAVVVNGQDSQNDMCLIRTDVLGNKLWSKKYGDIGSNELGRSVVETSDNGFALLGSTEPISSSSNATDFLLLKTDANGEVVWQKTYGGLGTDVGYSVQRTSEGGFVLLGWTTSFGDKNGDAYMVKTNANGEVGPPGTWQKTYGGLNGDGGFSVRQTKDGGFIFTGVFGQTSDGEGFVYLVKTDAVGEPSWQKIGGVTGEEWSWGNTVQQTLDGGYIVSGTAEKWSDPVWRQGIIKKYGANGEESWSKKADEIAPSLGCDYGFSIQQTADGGYVLFGAGGGWGQMTSRPDGTWPTKVLISPHPSSLLEMLSSPILLRLLPDMDNDDVTDVCDNDSDGDGLSNAMETFGCLDPMDADSDDDGIMDGNEDVDHDGVFGLEDNETDPCNPDTDGDGVYDGTEIGLTEPDISAATDSSKGIYIFDVDPVTKTDPTNPDSDDDGLIDGEEDINGNGNVDEGETDPNRKNVKALPFIPLLLLDE